MSDPRYRPSPSSSGGWPAQPRPVRPVRPVPPRAAVAALRWRQLADEPGCQWRSRAVRCVAEAVEVVRSREGVTRSSCERHVAAWLRTGATRLAVAE